MDTLKTFVVSTPLDARDAVGWILRISGALSVAHRKGEAHGRLSADAIVTRASSCDAQAWLVRASELADAAPYRDPTRLAGGPVTAADDVWALGVLLYQLLTGSLPFPGATVAEIRRRMAAGPPPPLAVFDVGDDELQLVLDRLFASRRDERITKLDELRGALLAWAPDLASLAPLTVAAPSEMVDEDSFDDDEEDAAPTAVWNVQDDPEIAATLARLREQAGAEPIDEGAISSPDIDASSLDVLVDSDDGLALLDTRDGGRRLSDMKALAPSTSDRAEAAVTPRMETPSEPSTDAPPTAPAAAADQPSGRTPWLVVAIASFCVVAGSIAAYLTVDRGEPSHVAPPVPSPTPLEGSVATAETEATVAGAPRAERSAPPPRPTAVAPAPAVPVTACVAPLFPEGTFRDGESGLDGICAIDDPVEGASTVRTRVVLAGRGRGVTPGMREWSALGWYAMAAFAVARGHCCPSAGPLVAPAVSSCEVDDRLTTLAGAASRGDETTAEQALEDYRKAIGCVVRDGKAALYGQASPPSAGELAVFRRVLARALTLAAARD